MNQQFNKLRTTLTLDPEVHQHYQAIAEKEDRSLSYIINRKLKEMMEKEKN
jgi:predicted transcriptional regulator